MLLVQLNFRLTTSKTVHISFSVAVKFLLAVFWRVIVFQSDLIKTVLNDLPLEFFVNAFTVHDMFSQTKSNVNIMTITFASIL